MIETVLKTKDVFSEISLACQNTLFPNSSTFLLHLLEHCNHQPFGLDIRILRANQNQTTLYSTTGIQQLNIPEYYRQLKPIQNKSIHQQPSIRTQKNIELFFPLPNNSFIMGFPEQNPQDEKLWLLVQSKTKSFFSSKNINRWKRLAFKISCSLSIIDFRNQQQQLSTFKNQEETVAILVHQLKSPLNTLHSSLHLIQAEKEHPLLQDCSSLIKKTRSLIDEYLSYLKINQIQLTWVSTKVLFQEVEHYYQMSLHRLSISLHIDPSLKKEGLSLRGNLSFVFQVFQNLIDNAIKSIQKNGSISIKQVSHSNSTLCLVVVDSGEGIELTMSDKVFSPFVTKFRNGHGLGLSCCKRIMTLVGGHISYGINNNQEKGFFLTFTHQQKSYA